jgi:retron-type reverse transcriptase
LLEKWRLEHPHDTPPSSRQPVTNFCVYLEELLFRGHPDVVDADLADYFGSIPHTDLLKSVARRIVDRRVLHLIKMWLECPVEETDHRGRTRRTTEARDSRRGIPQGSPLTPPTILQNCRLISR